jgi:hypothetical protein
MMGGMEAWLGFMGTKLQLCPFLQTIETGVFATLREASFYHALWLERTDLTKGHRVRPGHRKLGQASLLSLPGTSLLPEDIFRTFLPKDVLSNSQTCLARGCERWTLTSLRSHGGYHPGLHGV